MRKVKKEISIIKRCLLLNEDYKNDKWEKGECFNLTFHGNEVANVDMGSGVNKTITLTEGDEQPRLLRAFGQFVEVTTREKLEYVLVLLSINHCFNENNLDEIDHLLSTKSGGMLWDNIVNNNEQILALAHNYKTLSISGFYIYILQSIVNNTH